MSFTVKLRAQLVKPNFAINMKQDEKTLVDFIMEELKGVDIGGLATDPEFLKYLADVIENQVSKKKEDVSPDVKPNKMEILVTILKNLYPKITADEIKTCKGIVEYLLKSKHVKKTKLSKVMVFYLKKRFFPEL